MAENFPPLGFGSFASSTQLMRDSALLRATTELFLHEETHTPDEVRRYEELIAHLLPKVADADRVFLAERLANRADAPQAVIRMLAKDKIAIAEPVLRASPVLAALDLLSIVAATGPDHHRVIAERRALPSEVQQALRISSDRALAAVLDEMEAANAVPPVAVAKPAVTESALAKAERPSDADQLARTAASWPATREPAIPESLPAKTDRPSEPKQFARPTPLRPAAPEPVAAEAAKAESIGDSEPSPPPAPPPPPREPIAVRAPARLDPWSFVELDRTARLRLMVELASRPPSRHHGGPSGRIDRAFRAILGAAQIVGLARRGEIHALIQAIAGSLELDRDFIKACLDDATGEPLAILLKALGLDNVQAQQVFLLATPRVGRDTHSFFRISDIYAGMEPSVAEILAEAWRESRLAKTPRHVPHLAENGNRVRTGAEQIRPSAGTQPERKVQGSSGEPA